MKVAVIGTGTMGAGIAQQFSSCGHEVLFGGTSLSSYERGVGGIEKQLARSVEKGRMTQEEKETMLSRFSYLDDYAKLKDCFIIVEAIPEDMQVKKDLFAKLNEQNLTDTIIATNTSSLSITEMSTAYNKPEKLVGMHFFNPVPVMKLVEVIKGMATSQDTVDTVNELATSLGKTPVLVEEAPGFVVNRILIPMINEAVGILADGVASKEDIDTAMKLGANHPIGPLELADLVGLDICLNIMDVLYDEFKDPKYRAHPLLAKMVRGNKLGRKTKQGFYSY